MNEVSSENIDIFTYYFRNYEIEDVTWPQGYIKFLFTFCFYINTNEFDKGSVIFTYEDNKNFLGIYLREKKPRSLCLHSHVLCVFKMFGRIREQISEIRNKNFHKLSRCFHQAMCMF